MPKIVGSNILFDQKSGYWYRAGTTHLKTVKEPPREYAPMNPGPDDRLLDIGAHVGGFLGWAVSHGCTSVHSYEPAPDTFQVLKKNLACRLSPGLDLKIFQAAVVGDSSKTIKLWMTSNHQTKASSMASINYARGRTYVVVPAVQFNKIVTTYRPTGIKVDIEGGEYHLDFSCLPDSVDKFAIELHWVNRERERERCMALAIGDVLEEQGFREVITGRLKKPFREKSGWNWQVTFVR